METTTQEITTKDSNNVSFLQQGNFKV